MGYNYLTDWGTVQWVYNCTYICTNWFWLSTCTNQLVFKKIHNVKACIVEHRDNYHFTKSLKLDDICKYCIYTVYFICSYSLCWLTGCVKLAKEICFRSERRDNECLQSCVCAEECIYILTRSQSQEC